MSLFVARPAWRNRAVIWPHLGQFAILGFLAMCLFQSLSYLAAETTTATNMAVFTALTPLLTVGLSAAVLGEDPTLGMIGGVVLSFAGLIYLVSGGDLSSLARDGVHPGDALMLLAAFVYALYGVLLKRWNLPVTGWQSTYMQALCALAVMFPAFLATPGPLRQLNAETLPLIGYAGGLASVVLPFLWIRGVEQLGPNRCAVFMNLLPVLTAAAAIVMLGEPVRAFHVIGGGLALAGVAAAQAFRRPLSRRTALLGEGEAP
jgi:drug/metabolite transporter (DMT)-like permease